MLSQEGCEQSVVTIIQRGIRKALIEKRCTQRNESFVDKDVGVQAGCFQQNVAMSPSQPEVVRHSAARGQQSDVRDTLAAGSPQELQREGFPLAIAPGLDRFAAELIDEAIEHAGRALVRWTTITQVAHGPVSRLLNR